MARSYFFAGCGAAALFLATACGSSPPSLGADDSTAGDTSTGGAGQGGAGQGGAAGVSGSTFGGGVGATAGSGMSGAGAGGTGSAGKSGASAGGTGSAGKSSGGAGGTGSAGKSGGGAGGAGSAGKSGGGAGGAGSAGKSGGGAGGASAGGGTGVENTTELCTNGMDDDGDGKVDCDDPDCIGTFYCPTGWTCPYDAYFDGQCDCGCGVVDGDCSDPSPDSCMEIPTASCCDSTCSNLNPQDNSKCF